MSNKAYIGDSIYADFDGNQIRMYTDNGYGPENVIFLETEIFQSLRDYGEKMFGLSNIHNPIQIMIEDK
jgi:hypothetical protein